MTPTACVASAPQTSSQPVRHLAEQFDLLRRRVERLDDVPESSGSHCPFRARSTARVKELHVLGVRSRACRRSRCSWRSCCSGRRCRTCPDEVGPVLNPRRTEFECFGEERRGCPEESTLFSARGRGPRVPSARRPTSSSSGGAHPCMRSVSPMRLSAYSQGGLRR